MSIKCISCEKIIVKATVRAQSIKLLYAKQTSA